MRIEMTHKLKPRRGGEVKVGNVYTNAHGKNIFKIVVGITDQKKRSWVLEQCHLYPH